MTRRTMLAMAATAFAADRKNRVPISKEPLNVTIPEATAVKLSNGLTVLAMEDNRLPLVWVRIQIDGAGKLYSPKPGLSELTADTLDQGTKTRGAKQIAQDATRFGSTVRSGVFSNRESATIDASGLSNSFSDWLGVTCDVLANPSFAADEFTSMRERVVTANRLSSVQPNTMADQAILKMAYGSHPGADPRPSEEDFRGITPSMAAAWHQERYAPANTVVTVIGRLKPSAVASELEKRLGSWKTPAPSFALPPEPKPLDRRILMIDRANALQTRIELGNLLFPRADPDFFPLLILQYVLGVGANSRLAQFEAAGKVAQSSSTYGTARYTGFWLARATVRTDSTESGVTMLLDALRRLCDEPVSAAELDIAKSAASGRYALTLEQPSEVINNSYQRYRYGFSTDYWERYPARLNAVTAAEVQAVAQKYFRPEKAHIVAVGDAAKIRPMLAKFGKVES